MNYPVLKLADKFLSSTRDPLAEALSWVKRMEPLLDHKNFICLGGASGYHLRALLMHQPNARLLVLDFDQAVHEFLAAHEFLTDPRINMAILARSPNFEILLLKTIIEFLKNDGFSYRVLPFMPAMQYALADFQNCSQLLNQRTAEGFSFLQKLDPTFQIFNSKEQNQTLMSIQDLSMSEVAIKGQRREQQWLLLKELLV